MRIAFILGAGASKEYGYPLGSEIKADLLSQLNPKCPMFAGLLGAGNSAEDIAELKKSLFRADYETIDQFIAAQHRHPEIQRIGRQAIALCISRFENEKNLFNAGPSWYKRLIDFLRVRPELLKRDHLSFFTFNYDRSLEHYLHETVSRGGGGFSDTFMEEFFYGNFIHIHGVVGYLPWQNAPENGIVRDYGTPIDPKTVKALADNLLTPEQEVSLTSELQNRLLESEIVAIMGFGFHQQNLAKIQFSKLANQQGKKVYVTVHSLETEKRDFLASHPAVTAIDSDCVNFIRNFVAELAKTRDL